MGLPLLCNNEPKFPDKMLFITGDVDGSPFRWFDNFAIAIIAATARPRLLATVPHRFRPCHPITVRQQDADGILVCKFWSNTHQYKPAMRFAPCRDTAPSNLASILSSDDALPGILISVSSFLLLSCEGQPHSGFILFSVLYVRNHWLQKKKPLLLLPAIVRL